jgi:hypothetical protein
VILLLGQSSEGLILEGLIPEGLTLKLVGLLEVGIEGDLLNLAKLFLESLRRELLWGLVVKDCLLGFEGLVNLILMRELKTY